MKESVTGLSTKRCGPCHRETPKLTQDAIAALLLETPAWSLDGEKIQRALEFKDFPAAMKFINAMANLAELEQHHPDFYLHDWNRVEVTLSTHAIHGLSENDFILAAKIDALLATHPS
ncbi:MAG: 4a-hydroxytetrahydrobiopterin dehydratase [Polyangiales bacterium]